MLRKLLLSPYYLTLRIRHALYDKGIFKVHTCDTPTICVGNIAAGGTGKTPHTEMILETLLESEDWKDKNIAVLSRGHKRNSSGFQQILATDSAAFSGDEPLQIKKKFPEVTMAVDRTRVEGCDFLSHPEKVQTAKAARKCKNKAFPAADLIVLDDAFQYRSLKASFNIVLIDYNRPPCDDMLLPFGRLRDLPMRLHYANILIVSKCPPQMETWEKINWVKAMGIRDFDAQTFQGIDKWGKRVTILFTTVTYSTLKPVFEESDPRYMYSKNLILFSGIAKDTPLRRYMSDSYNIVRRFKFADHHKYNRFDIRRILLATKVFPTALVATTEKDCQRILDYKRIPDTLRQRMFQIPIEVKFLSDKEKSIFEATLLGALKNGQKEASLS